jgi:hypothetical protein
MAENIVQSLFGFTPEAVQQQMYQAGENRAMQLAQMSRSPVAASEFYGLRAAERFGAAPLFGPSPQVQKASNLQSILQQAQSSGADFSTPEGLVQLADLFNRDPQFAGIATGLRQEAAKLTQSQTKFAYDIAAKGAEITERGARTAESEARVAKLEFANTQEENLRTELSNLPANASEEQILAVYRRYGSADQQSRAIQASLDRRARLADQNRMMQPELNNNGVPQGRVDAKGNFFDNSGRKVASKEFVDAEQSHNTALDLLSTLRQVTEKDINTAFGSFIDYTQSDPAKFVGSRISPETQKAQYKINQVGVKTILENLQKLKGASTDKEMQKVASTFPGYQAQPDVMKEWVDEAIRVTNNFLRRSERRYGFDTTYETENRFGTKGPKKPSAAEVPSAPTTSMPAAQTEGAQGWKILNVR